MEEFISKIDDIIDEFEFKNICFVDNNYVKNTELCVNYILKENNVNNSLLYIKINYLLGLINKLNMQITDSYNFFIKSLDLAKKLNNDLWLARIYSKLSLFKDFEDMSKLNHYHFNAIQYCKNVDCTKIKLYIYIEKIIYIYHKNNNLDSIVVYIDKIENMLKNSKEKYTLSIYIILSYFELFILKDMKKGINYIEVALDLALNLSSKYNLLNIEAISNIYIAKVYMTYIIKPKDVIRILEPILLEEKYKSINTEIKFTISIDLINAYLEENRLSKAMERILYIIDNIKLISHPLAKNITIALLYFAAKSKLYAKNFDVALEYALEAEDKLNSLEVNNLNINLSFNIKLIIARIYFNLNQYEKSLSYCKSLLEKEDTLTIIEKKKLYYCLGEIYEYLNDDYCAYWYFNKYVNIHNLMIQDDSILIFERLQKNLENKYKTHVIENLYKSNTTMIKDTYIDKLTKVLNKNYLVENKLDLHNAFSIGIIMIDIDYFKKYNDGYGHIKGDLILSSVASKIKDICGDDNIVIRYGGEEFIVVCYNTDKLSLKILGETLCNEVFNMNLEHNFSEISNRVTISAGCCYKTVETTDSYLHLIELADKSLYKAKENGRNQCFIN